MLHLRRHMPLLTHSTRLGVLVLGVAAHLRDGSGSLQVVSGHAAAVDHVDSDDADHEKMDTDRRPVAASSGLAGHSKPSASSPNARAQGVGTLGRDVARRSLQPDTTDASGDPVVDYLPLGNTQSGTYAAAADTGPTYEVVEDFAPSQQRSGYVVLDSPYAAEAETDDDYSLAIDAGIVASGTSATPEGIYSTAIDTGIVASGTSATPEGIYSTATDVAEDTVARRPPRAVAHCDATLPRLPPNASGLGRRRSLYNGFDETEDA